MLSDGPCLTVSRRGSITPGLEKLLERCGGLDLRMATDAATPTLCWGELPAARTSKEAMPLQSESIAAVVLCHVVARGEEGILREACKTLQPNGRLFILGLNRWGARYLAGKSNHGLPGISPLAVRKQLEGLDMEVSGLFAAGFWRGEKPGRMNRGLARILVPLADLFLIVAHPKEPRIMNPISKTKLRAMGAPSALAGP